MSEHRTPSPQTLIFEKGYDPQRSEGAAVPPVFRTSTFIFKRAVDGKRAFELAYGLRPREQGESPALIYTRVNNPNSEILEDRVTAWDGAEAAALFSSGMGAISSTCLTLLRPGDTILFSDPIYGGTEYLFRKLLPEFGVVTVPFPAGATEAELAALAEAHPGTRIIYLESPANPTMELCDVPAARRVADRLSTPGRPVLVLIDNTFLGPIFSQPLAPGADVVLYSATKFFGGHSDLVAGLAMGSAAIINAVRATRTILGSMSDPDTAWLIHRSLGTLQLRMEKQQENTVRLVELLRTHPKVKRVYYPGLAGDGGAPGGALEAAVHRRRQRGELRRAGRRGRGLPGAGRGPAHAAGGEPGRHRDAGRAPVVDDPRRHDAGAEAPGRLQPVDDQALGGARGSGRPGRRPGAGAGEGVTPIVRSARRSRRPPWPATTRCG